MRIAESPRFNRARRLLLGGCFGLAVACGGKVAGTETGGADSAANGAAGAASSDGGALDFPSQSLETCKLGTLPAEGVPCPWMAGGRCYQTVSAACACACPRDHASLCTSGFPSGSDGQVVVACE